MDLLLWIDDIAIVCFGFIGGVYFAFSFFVMHSFKKINHLEAIRIMNSINSVILKWDVIKKEFNERIKF